MRPLGAGQRGQKRWHGRRGEVMWDVTARYENTPLDPHGDVGADSERFIRLRSGTAARFTLHDAAPCAGGTARQTARLASMDASSASRCSDVDSSIALSPRMDLRRAKSSTCPSVTSSPRTIWQTTSASSRSAAVPISSPVELSRNRMRSTSRSNLAATAHRTVEIVSSGATTSESLPLRRPVEASRQSKLPQHACVVAAVAC